MAQLTDTIVEIVHKRSWFVYLLVGVLSGAFGFGLACTSAQNMTKATKISEAIDLMASPSAVLSDCWQKNAMGKGGNARNCDKLADLYEMEWVKPRKELKAKIKALEKVIRAQTERIKALEAENNSKK